MYIESKATCADAITEFQYFKLYVSRLLLWASEGTVRQYLVPLHVYTAPY